MTYALNRIARNHAQQATLQQATLPPLQAPLPQVTQPSTQQKKRNEKTRLQYKRRTLQQDIAEDIASSSSVIMKKKHARPHRASAADLPRLRTWLQSTGNPRAGKQAFQLLACGVPPLYLPKYIRCAEEMEPTGQG